MTSFISSNWTEILDLTFPPEWVKASLVLALFATAVVIGLFLYLNRYTRKSYFTLWTVAWLFYGGYLAASISIHDAPGDPLLTMTQLACIGCGALFMFWGSFQLTQRTRRNGELGGGLVLLVVWSYVAAYEVQSVLWITYPVFFLLAAASFHTGILYYRNRKQYRSANVLAAGFVLWAMHLLVYPCHQFMSTGMVAASYFGNAVLAFFIAMGMIAQMLEEARERNETLVAEYLKGVARRRLLEQAVSATEQKYSVLFDAASDAIFLVDLDTMKIVEANQAAQRLVQRTSADLIGRAISELCPELRAQGEALLDKKRAFDSVFRPSHEFVLLLPAGAQVECEGSLNLLQCDTRPVVQLNIREIGERKRLEHQLRRAEKLSAIGQLVAGVAHELNNPLAVIMGFAQIMAKQKAIDERTKVDLLKIVHESERAAKIVKNLLTFAQPREPHLAPVDVNTIITNVLAAHERHVQMGDLHVRRFLRGDLPKCMADVNQLEQVITNLVVNAIHALSTHNGMRVLELKTDLSDSLVRISVSDTGPGIPKAIQNRIFDPFFTTKAPGKGTGLGLSISHTIITEHHGRLWFDSVQGQGTRFHIELPLAVAAEEPLVLPATDDRASAAATRAHAHRVLVVDDEPGIVEVLREVLTSVGYSVDTATNGAEALSRVSSGLYDAIISDLCMPEVSGRQFYEMVREIRPDLARRIIFVTGDTVSPDSRSFLEGTGNRWFSKPFDIEEIEQVVEDAMREEEPAAAVC